MLFKMLGNKLIAFKCATIGWKAMKGNARGKRGQAMTKNELPLQEEYKYGFHDKDTSVYNTGKGLTRDTIVEISTIEKRAAMDVGISFKGI